MYEEIISYLEQNKVPKFRIKQLEDAIFKQFITDFDQITVYPKFLRDDLKQKFSLTSLTLIKSHKSNDTIKFVFKTKENQFIESVLMLHKDNRRTVCVSSQIFCALGCKFCATGANKFRRNLSTQEIIEQVLFISNHLKTNNERVTNIVFMGMGEPFLNYDNVVESIKIFNDENKFNIGARHITVSTSGIVPKIYEFAELGIQIRLAISLHAPNDKLRSEIMPINNKYPLSELMKACDNFSNKTNKRISYEYVLIKDINDNPKHATELAKLLKNRLSHINLLIYNPHEFATYEKPDIKTVMTFKEILQSEGIEVSIRKSLGDDISGACGQLAAKP